MRTGGAQERCLKFLPDRFDTENHTPMTILNERRKRRSPRWIKWVIFFAVLAGFFYMLYQWGGEQPLERIEQPVTLDDKLPGETATQ